MPQFLPFLTETLADQHCLIQVVDDGSHPGELQKTQALVEDLRQRFPQLAPILSLPVNQGKGGAIRAGWRAHLDSDLLGFVDADGSISPAEVRRVLELVIANPAEAVFASRVKMLGREVQRSLFRHLVGRVFATIASLRLGIDAYDTQCGFKVIPASIMRNEAVPLTENGFAFDLELLVTLVDQGIPIREIPIDWTHKEGSKVHLVRDSTAMYLSLNRIAQRRNKK